MRPNLWGNISLLRKQRFAEVTRENIGRRLAIIVDGRICSAPVIQGEISGGKAQITGNFSEKEAKELAAKISFAITEK